MCDLQRRHDYGDVYENTTKTNKQQQQKTISAIFRAGLGKDISSPPPKVPNYILNWQSHNYIYGKGSYVRPRAALLGRKAEA